MRGRGCSDENFPHQLVFSRHVTDNRSIKICTVIIFLVTMPKSISQSIAKAEPKKKEINDLSLKELEMQLIILIYGRAKEGYEGSNFPIKGLIKE